MMKAAVFKGAGNLQLTDVPIPRAGRDGMVLKVGSNTVCGTDLRILRGEKSAGIDVGTILGHEIAGYVAEVGSDVEGFALGDLVAINPTVPCGRCHYCTRGLEHLCLHASLYGYRIDGGLAEYVKVTAQALQRGGVYKVAPHVTPVEASLSEPLGCVINGVRNYEPKLGDSVFIIGAGPIGLLHTQMVKHLGASQVIVSDMSAPRRALAQQLGATHTIDPTEVDPVECVKDITDGLGANVTVMCIGRPELFQQALEATRRRGHVSTFAGFPKGVMAHMDPNLIHYAELSVTGGSNCGVATQELAIKLIEDKAINVKALHTHTFGLSEVREGIEFVSSGEGIKVAIVPEDLN